MKDRSLQIKDKLMKAASAKNPNQPEPQKMKAHGDHASNKAVMEANKAGMAEIGGQKAQNITANDPVQIRQQLSNSLKDIAPQETKERKSHHIIGAAVKQAIGNLAESRVQSTPESYQSASQTHKGHPLVDMFDELANSKYSGQEVHDPFHDRTYSDTELEPAIKAVAEHYPEHQSDLTHAYKFGRDTNAATIQAQNMLHALNKYHQTKDETYLRAAKDAAVAATKSREVKGRHLPPNTFGIANKLIEGSIPEYNAAHQAISELDFHTDSDPGMLSYKTSRALATHHLNKLENQAKGIVQPKLDELSNTNFSQITPEQAQVHKDHINQALKLLSTYNLGGITPRYVSNAKSQLKYLDKLIDHKFGFKKSLDLPKRINHIKEKLKGGKADGMKDSQFDAKQLDAGMKVESEHTPDPQIQREIAQDHLSESPKYYKELKNMERKLDLEKYNRIRSNLFKCNDKK